MTYKSDLHVSRKQYGFTFYMALPHVVLYYGFTSRGPVLWLYLTWSCTMALPHVVLYYGYTKATYRNEGFQRYYRVKTVYKTGDL